MEELIKNISTTGWYPPQKLSKEYLKWSTDTRVLDAVVSRWNSVLLGKLRIKDANPKYKVYRYNIRRHEKAILMETAHWEGAFWTIFDNAVPIRCVLSGTAWFDVEYYESEKN